MEVLTNLVTHIVFNENLDISPLFLTAVVWTRHSVYNCVFYLKEMIRGCYVEDDEHTLRSSFFTWKVKELKEISVDCLIIVAV